MYFGICYVACLTIPLSHRCCTICHLMRCLFSCPGSDVIANISALDARVKVVRAGSFAESTKRTCNSNLSCYLSFVISYLSPHAFVCCGFRSLHCLLSLKLKFNSIMNYFSVIRLLHVEAGVSNPTQCHYIASIVRGTRRLLGQGVLKNSPSHRAF